MKIDEKYELIVNLIKKNGNKMVQYLSLQILEIVGMMSCCIQYVKI